MAGEESLSEERRGETLKQVWEGEQRNRADTAGGGGWWGEGRTGLQNSFFNRGDNR